MNDSAVTQRPHLGQTAAMRDTPEPGRRNIRSRIAITVIVLIGLALALVGVTLWTVERATTETQIEADLWRAVEEFDTLARYGVDPATGRPFEDPAGLLLVALQRTALGPTEGELGVVDGKLRWTAPEGVQLRPELDDELMAELLPMAELDQTSHGDFTTPTTRYRYVVVPVSFEATGESGALIRVVDVNA